MTSWNPAGSQFSRTVVLDSVVVMQRLGVQVQRVVTEAFPDASPSVRSDGCPVHLCYACVLAVDLASSLM